LYHPPNYNRSDALHETRGVSHLTFFFFWISNEVLYQKKTQRTHKLQSKRAPTQTLTAQRTSKYTRRIQRDPNKDPLNKAHLTYLFGKYLNRYFVRYISPRCLSNMK
jgi:hypothetical protein